MTAPLGTAIRHPEEEGAARPLLRALRAHRLLIVATTLAALLAAAAYLYVREPTYEATATVLVTPLPQEDDTFLGLGLLRDSGDATRTAQTAAALLDSPEAAADVAVELGPGWSEKKVLDRVDVAPQGESNIIAVTGAAEDARLAADLATGFVEATLAVRAKELRKGIGAAIERSEAELGALAGNDPNRAVISAQLSQLRSIQETGDPTLTLQQPAIVPTSASSPGPIIVLPLALLAGLALGIGGALLRDFTDRRISDEDEIAMAFPLPVLTRVPELSRRTLRGPAGASWFVPPQIREAFLTLSLQFEQRGKPLSAVMVTSATRGDGKTSTSINLAVTLASTGRRVILLDFDLRNPKVATMLGFEEAWSGADLADPYRSLPQLLVPTKLEHLEILPIQPLAGDAMSEEEVTRRLSRYIAQARELADHVIVDTPPLGEVSDALRIGNLVDDIIIVARPGNTDQRHLTVLRELLERTGQSPEGYVLIGAREYADRGYGYGYGYGAAGRTGLVVGQDEAESRAAEPSAERVPEHSDSA